LSAAKPWVKVDVGRISQQRGLDLRSLLKTSPTPTSALAYLRGSRGRVEKIGNDTVSGVATTHYKVTVDLEQAAARANGEARKSLREVIRLGGVKKLPFDVWLDGDGYVRKMVYAEQSGRGAAARVSMVLHDFGSRVTIERPPSDKVVDFTSILQQGP
jgi:hypothetical protein